ncbi:5-methylcytosine restriction system specificity protein McrC [Neobacillus mesonae]|uniref:5-methylcytosine restriction system specificity protein McrC n=1 Tax=Neobacillus mesonae TaxID=1193713 RepID=UPI0008339D35|nr:hypothetical protein [Neobacillus mesonae]
MYIKAKDLSVIPNLDKEQEEWLREVAKVIVGSNIMFSFLERHAEDEPVLSFDEKRSLWRTGRYIGEILYKGKTLTIEPRFGMVTIRHWLSRIFGVKLFDSTGKYQEGRLWIWELIAKLWSNKLMIASKHGLPYTRRNQIYLGQSIRGRLLVPQTAMESKRGSKQLISMTREKQLDETICNILLLAYDRINQALHVDVTKTWWTTGRTRELIMQIKNQFSYNERSVYALLRKPIRYTPINESYRSLVNLSLPIINQQALQSTVVGEEKVIGTLIDMAELWELYLYHLLDDGLTDLDVKHIGRSDEENDYLLKSRSGQFHGRLKPDILLNKQKNTIGIVDAKYKNTESRPDRPKGIVREDLYQMTAYLSAYHLPNERTDAFLVYPILKGNQTALSEMENESPWKYQNIKNKNLHFLRLEVDPDIVRDDSFNTLEQSFLSKVRRGLG